MTKSVLFLCTGNSCRSQMAEALLRSLSGGRALAQSAGVNPVGIHPMARQTLAEAGLDMQGQSSKHVDSLAGQSFDLVVTVCDNAGRRCPTFAAGTQRLHWDINDPAQVEGDEQTRLNAFRAVREELRRRILQLLEQWPPAD